MSEVFIPPPRPRRTSNVCIALTEEEKSAISKAAWEDDCSVSDLIRRAVAKQLRKRQGNGA